MMPTPTPPPQGPYNDQPSFAPQPPQKGHGHKGLIATIITLAILLLGALGFIAYLLYLQPKPAPETATTPTTSDTDDTKKSGDADKVIASIRAALTETILPSYKEATINDGTTSPAYKEKDAQFSVAGTNGYSLSIDPSPVTGYDEKATKAVQDGIINTLGSKSRFTVKSTEWSKTYQDDTVICEVSIGSAPINVSCANVADYAQAIEKAKPFAAAFFASEVGKEYGTGLLISNITITQKAGGYSRAVIALGNTQNPIGGFAGLFYAKDSNWTYFKGTQAIMLCADYNTYDIQASFEGYPCFASSESTEPTTVKLTLTR